MKWLLDVFAILLLLLLAAVTFFMFSFHPDKYQQELQQWVKNQGWQLEYSQSDWSIQTPFHWTLHNLRLSQGNQLALSANTISLNLAPRPLFSRQVEFSEVLLHQTHLIADLQQLQINTKESVTIEIPFVSSIKIHQLFIDDADVTLQNGTQPVYIEQMQLSVEEWQLFSEQNSWQLRLLANAKQVQLPELTLDVPQISLNLKPSNFDIDHLSADLLHGSIYGSGSWQESQLDIQQLVLNNLRVDDPSSLKLTHLLQMKPQPWLQSAQFHQLLINQISLETQWQQQNIVLNRLTAEVRQLSWGAEGWQGGIELICDELTTDQVQIGKITANGQIEPQAINIEGLTAHLFGGDVQFIGRYQWPNQQRDLDIFRLTLDNNELPIQPQWVTAERSAIPILNNLHFEHIDINNVKVLSYLEQLPLAAEGINLELTHLDPIKDGQWQSLASLWQPNTQLFLELPELAYRGLHIQRLSADIGSESDQGYFNLYGELPLGQLEISGNADLNLPMKPWIANISGLLLDVDPLVRLTKDPNLEITGDITIDGQLSGEVTTGLASMQGRLKLTSQGISINRDLEKPLNQWIDHPNSKLQGYQESLILGTSALWKTSLFTEGQSQGKNITLDLQVQDGIVQPNAGPLMTQPLTWQLSGKIDLVAKNYEALTLSYYKDDCQSLSRSLNGPWLAPAIEVTHYQTKQTYLPLEGRFIKLITEPDCKAAQPD